MIPTGSAGSGPSGEESAESDFTKKRRRNWPKLIAKVYFDDPEVCCACGERMKIVAAITSPHQDDVIERVLRHLNLWDPPWNRQRRARGPPSPSSEVHGTELSPQGDLDPGERCDPEPRLEDYAVDPPSQEDL